MHSFLIIASLLVAFSSWSMEESPATKIEEQENNTFERVKNFLNNHRDKINLRDSDNKDNKEELIDIYIENLASYSCLLEKYGLISPLSLTTEDLPFFENLQNKEMLWNNPQDKEINLKNLDILTRKFNFHSRFTGGFGLFDEFTRLQESTCAGYVWHETERALSPKELDDLAKKYKGPLQKDLEKTKLEKLYRADIEIKANSDGLIELEGKTYLRKAHFQGKFLDIPNDWDPRQNNLFMSSPKSTFPLSEQFKDQNVSKVLKLQHVIHLARRQEYHQQQGKGIKTIPLIWPTRTMVPRYIILDTFYISWLDLLLNNSALPILSLPNLSFVVLNDNLELARKGGVYKTGSVPVREQVLIVEVSYINELEVSEEKFREMEKKLLLDTKAFWDTTDLAGINLSSVDLLIVKQDNGDKFYLPRHIANQILPSYLVEILPVPQEIEKEDKG